MRLLRRATVGDYVPWLSHVRDDVILLEDGSVLAFCELSGLAHETLEGIDLEEFKQRLNRTWVQSSRNTVTVTIWQYRGPASSDVYPETVTTNAFSQSLNIAYKAHLLSQSLYENRVFLGVQIRPPAYMKAQKGVYTRALALIGRDASEADADDDLMQQLDDLMPALMSELRRYKPHRMGVRIRNHITFSEIAEALALLTTGRWRPVGMTTGKLGESIYTEHVDFEWDFMKFLAPTGIRHAAQLSFQHFPSDSHPLMLASLLQSSYHCTIKHSFRFIPTTRALEIIGRKQWFMMRFNDRARVQRDSLPDLMSELSDHVVVMGDYSCSALVFSETEAGLEKVSAAAFTDLAESGAKIVRETLGLKPAWLSLVPGMEHLNARSGYITSRNFASLAPMFCYPIGNKEGRWGNPITVFRSAAGTPVRFHWHQDDIGNTLVTGQTGSGKTTLVAFLLAMTAARARIIGMDHKRGWNLLFNRMGGEYTILGNGKPNFAPMRSLDNTPDDRTFLFDLIRGCIMSDGAGSLTSDQERRLALGVDMVMSLPREQRDLWEVRCFLGVEPNGAGARLEKWCWGKELGWVIDAPKDAISLDGRLHGLDTTSLLTNTRAREPALLYLFYRINKCLDGTPTLIPIDEGWRVPFSETFAFHVEAQIRTIRSKNGLFVFITQGVDEILRAGRLARVLVEQCPTQIHLPNPRATKADYVDGLKRTNGEFAILKQLQPQTGFFLLCQGNQSMVAQLPLLGMDEYMAVLSAPEAALKKYDEALA